MDSKKTSVSAIVGLVLAVIALLLSAIPVINNFAFVLAVLGLILGIIGLKKVTKGQRDGKKIAIVAIVLSLIAGAIVIASQAFYVETLDEASKSIDEATKKVDESVDKATGNSTEELLKNDVSVTFGVFTATQDEYGLNQTALPITVTNKNKAAKSYSIQVEAVNEAGTRIADDTISVNALGANQTQEFKAFEFVQSDKIESLKTATFKVVKVSQY